jgi:hypothetical protein
MRLCIRYVATVNVPEPNKFFLHSVRILTEEAASGAHSFEHDEQMLEFALAGVRKEYGEVKLRNSAVFKTLMKVKWIGQMVIDVEKDNERMLLDIVIGKQVRGKRSTRRVHQTDLLMIKGVFDPAPNKKLLVDRYAQNPSRCEMMQTF